MPSRVMSTISLFPFVSLASINRSSDSIWIAIIPPLRSKRTYRGALDKAAMGDADNATLVGDEIFHVYLALVRHQLSQSRRCIFVAKLAQLFLDDGEDALFLGQDVAQIFDRLEQLL